MSAFEIDSLKLEVSRLKRDLASERAARREAEKPNPEIYRLKRELASAKQEASDLSGRPTSGEIHAERAARVRAEKDAESLRSDIAGKESTISRLKADLEKAKTEARERPSLRDINSERSARVAAERNSESLRTEIESKEADIARLKKEVGKLKSEAKGLRSMFTPGPDLEKRRLRNALKAAKIEMWRLRNVSNQQ